MGITDFFAIHGEETNGLDHSYKMASTNGSQRSWILLIQIRLDSGSVQISRIVVNSSVNGNITT